MKVILFISAVIAGLQVALTGWFLYRFPDILGLTFFVPALVLVAWTVALILNYRKGHKNYLADYLLLTGWGLLMFAETGFYIYMF